MRVALRTDTCGNDIDRLCEYASKLGIQDIWAFPEVKDLYSEKGRMRLKSLLQYQTRCMEGGLNLRILTERIDENVLLSTMKYKAKALSHTINVMGKAGIDTLFLFVSVAHSEEKNTDEKMWKRLVKIYQEIVPCAEDAGVFIASHGHQTPRFMIRNYEGLNRLLKAVPSDHNGVTFCMGCHQLAGDDIYETIQRFGKKIFFVHARDVMWKPNGFDEVAFDQGEVDVLKALEELQKINYQGLVCPEHLPRISYEPYRGIIGTSWGIGYLVSALKCLEIKDKKA